MFCFSRKSRNATSEFDYDSEGVPPIRKPRKNDSPSEKVAVLRRHLIDRVPVSDLCDEYQLQASRSYTWQKLFFENGSAAFESLSGTGTARRDPVPSYPVRVTLFLPSDEHR
jgi:hypothetical protein